MLDASVVGSLHEPQGPDHDELSEDPEPGTYAEGLEHSTP